MVNKDAWGKAISGINSHSATARAHPTDVLMKGLVEWKVFGIRSSGVEQNFRKAAVVFGHRRESALPDTEEMHIKLSLDMQQHDRARIIKLARLVWSHCFGRPRTAHRRPRIDKGLKRKACHLEDEGVASISEAAFVRTRRRINQEALVAVSAKGGFTMDPRQSAPPLPSWTDKHDAEFGVSTEEGASAKSGGSQTQTANQYRWCRLGTPWRSG